MSMNRPTLVGTLGLKNRIRIGLSIYVFGFSCVWFSPVIRDVLSNQGLVGLYEVEWPVIIQLQFFVSDLDSKCGVQLATAMLCGGWPSLCTHLI
jgi:hypothetical protein